MVTGDDPRRQASPAKLRRRARCVTQIRIFGCGEFSQTASKRLQGADLAVAGGIKDLQIATLPDRRRASNTTSPGGIQF